MTVIKHKTVLITGAGAGIGQLLAVGMAGKGASKLVLWDINAEGLEQTKGLLSGFDLIVESLVIDICDSQEVAVQAELIAKTLKPVEILINNAGVIYGGSFGQQNSHQIEKTISVNLLAPLLLTRSFLPQLLASKGGHIVNVASAAGLVSNPGMAVYAASKWGLIGWSDSLRIELEKAGSKVHVTTVTPYYISTGMFDGVRSGPMLPILKPGYVANAVIKAIESNRLFLRMPWLIRLTPFAKGLLPVRWFDWFVGGILGVYRSMDHFKGHPNSK